MSSPTALGQPEAAVSSALQSGGLYRIINDQTKTAVQFNNLKEASGFSVSERDSQRWQALRTQYGWAFRNLETLGFLGRPSGIAIIPNGTRVVDATEFTWIVVPDAADETRFKLRVPYTGKLMNISNADPADGTPVNIWDDTMREQFWWRFERTTLQVEILAMALMETRKYRLALAHAIQTRLNILD
ncbi:hypothetical protein BKA70DRAFT_241507 [Coprinopsis sp. MPI-PUGE-AT-0042]|nr:hypothetical protein BKA70DRAFT_241507 [Coprinopsis sp. MPI-PUGE-AT-0042]